MAATVEWRPLPWPQQPGPRVLTLEERVAMLEHFLVGAEPWPRMLNWLADHPRRVPYSPLCERPRSFGRK